MPLGRGGDRVAARSANVRFGDDARWALCLHWIGKGKLPFPKPVIEIGKAMSDVNRPQGDTGQATKSNFFRVGSMAMHRH